MKKITTIVMLAILALSINAQSFAPRAVRLQKPIQRVASEQPSMDFGYCGEYNLSVGFNMAITMRVLIEIPQVTAAKFQGAQITHLDIAFGSFTGTKSKVVILNAPEDTVPLYSQDITITPEAWNEITLDTPYVIGEDSFFVGYEMTCKVNDYPIGVDGETTASPYGDYVGIYRNGVWEFLHLGDQGMGNNCITLGLSGDSLPKYDFALTELSVMDIIQPGTYFSICGTVQNLASMNVDSYDVTYRIGSMPAVTTTVNETIGFGETSTFQIDSLKIEEEGRYVIEVSVSNLDGHVDENEADNTLSAKVLLLTEAFNRKVLLENFSTANCGNCPRVHTWLKNILVDRNDVAWTVHHAGYYTDAFTVDASQSYCWFYADGGTFAPALMLDRRNMGVPGYTTSPVFFPESESMLEEWIDTALAYPAFVSLKIEDAYNEETREVTVKVSGEALADFENTPYLTIFLTESGMIGAQSGGGNSYEHSHALRKVMTATWGDELTVENRKFEASYTCTLDEEWLPENMEVIAFVSDFNNEDKNACKVHQTEWKKLNYDAAVNGVSVNKQYNVWVSGKKICIDGTYDKADVYTVDGRLVRSAKAVSTITMDNTGIYIIVVDGVSHKVII